MWLSLYSQVYVLQDRNQSGTQGSQEYHSQYQSKYNSASILNVIHESLSIFQESDSGELL